MGLVKREVIACHEALTLLRRGTGDDPDFGSEVGKVSFKEKRNGIDEGLSRRVGSGNLGELGPDVGMNLLFYPLFFA